jgi:hypothetical protein
MAKIQPKKVLTVQEQEQALQSLYSEDDKKNGSKVRVTIDFTQALHKQIKEEVDYNGQTIKGFVLALIRQYFENKQK